MKKFPKFTDGDFGVWIAVLLIFYSCCGCSSVRSLSEGSDEETPTPLEENLVELSEDLLKEFGIAPKQLSLLQYYSGEDSIILVQESKLRQSKITKYGKIISQDKKESKRIVIPPFTPGIAVKVSKTGQVWVTFSKNKKNILGWSPDKNGLYVMRAQKGYKEKVIYGKKLCQITSGYFGVIYVDLLNLIDNQSEDKIEEGRHVRGGP